MDLLRQIGGFFGWLTGVLAGVAASLYALGFLSNVAHNRLLGAAWFEATRDPAGYLETGSRIAAALLLFGTGALVAVVVLVTAGRLTISLVAWLLPHRDGRRGRIRDFVLDRAPWLAALASVGLLWLIRWVFDGATELDGLLFADPAALCEPRTVAQSEIVTSDVQELRRRADGIFVLSALILIAGGFAVLATRSGRRPMLPLTICAIASINALGAAPMAHGLFVEPTDRPSVKVMVESYTEEAGLRMVAVTRDGVWLWHPDTQDVHWIASGQVRYMQLSPPSPLRDPDCTRNRTEPEEKE